MTVRIGFVGAGFMGQLAHLRNYDRVDGCEVVALAEPRERLRERVARRYEIPATRHDHAALAADAADLGLDAVVAVQPYDRHHDVVPDLLRAGLPLFTEKPLAVTVETGERLADLAAERDLLHMVGYHKRSDPAMEYATDVVDEWRETGAYGDIRFVRITVPEGDWIAGAPDPITTDEEPPEAEREPLPETFDDEAGRTYDHYVNYYIHQVNALGRLLGDPYEVAHADDDGRLLVAESAGGVTGTIEQSPYRTSDRWEESILVGFDRGTVRVELPPPLVSGEAGRVTVTRDDGGTETTEPTMPPVAAMRRQAENFVAAVRGERDPPCDSREAVEDLRVAREYVRTRFGDG